MCFSKIATAVYAAIAVLLILSMVLVHFYFSHIAIILMSILLAISSLWQGYRFFKNEVKGQCIYHESIQINDLLSILAGSLSTFYLTKYLDLSPTLASVLVGIPASLIFKKHAPIIFMGTFVGMSAFARFSLIELVLATLFTALLYQYGKHAFAGIGGKLGLTAFAGTLVISIVTGPQIQGALEYGIDIEKWNMPPSFIIALLLASSLASMLTFFINQRLKNAVLSSSLVGLLFAFVGMLIIGQGDRIFESAAYCATFAGMTQSNHIKHLFMFLVAGFICGFMFISTLPLFVGLGGKLGACAFIAALASKTLTHLYKEVRHA